MTDVDRPNAETGARARRGEDEPIGSTLIRLEGRDALLVLHRISTQSLEDLGAGETRSTLFCDFRGRLLHRVAVAVTTDGAAWLLRADASARELIEHIERLVFREDVRVTDQGRGRAVRLDLDPGGETPGTLSESHGVPVRLRLHETWGLRVFDANDAPPEEDERRRIALGLPRHGREVHADFNPYEVGLAAEVHLDKGCFTGQEALMRLITYRSVRRRLVRVSGLGPTPAAPSDLLLAGATTGRLTSTVGDGPKWTGLAVVKHEALEAGAALAVEGGGPIEEATRFPETRPLGLP